MFSLVLFADDDSGDKITEGTFNSVEDAWNHNDRMGSKWIFYPIPVVVDNHTNQVVSACEGFEFVVGMSLTEFVDWLTILSPEPIV